MVAIPIQMGGFDKIFAAVPPAKVLLAMPGPTTTGSYGVYATLVLGSALRHMPVTARPADFRTAALFHVLVALALVVEIALLAIRVVLSARDEKPLLRPTIWRRKPRWR